MISGADEDKDEMILVFGISKKPIWANVALSCTLQGSFQCMIEVTTGQRLTGGQKADDPLKFLNIET